MATKERAKKTPAKKSSASKAKAVILESTSGESIGFLRASERAHVAVGDIPLTFMSDLNIMPDKMDSAKELNRKFVGGMYGRLDGMAAAPGKFKQFVVEKVGRLVSSDEAEKPNAKPVAKKATTKKRKAKASSKTSNAGAKPKAAAKPKVAAKPKAAVKRKAVAKPKARTAKAPATSKPKAEAKDTPASKPVADVDTPQLNEGMH